MSRISSWYRMSLGRVASLTSAGEIVANQYGMWVWISAAMERKVSLTHQHTSPYACSNTEQYHKIGMVSKGYFPLWNISSYSPCYLCSVLENGRLAIVIGLGESATVLPIRLCRVSCS